MFIWSRCEIRNFLLRRQTWQTAKKCHHGYTNNPLHLTWTCPCPPVFCCCCCFFFPKKKRNMSLCTSAFLALLWCLGGHYRECLEESLGVKQHPGAYVPVLHRCEEVHEKLNLGCWGREQNSVCAFTPPLHLLFPSLRPGSKNRQSKVLTGFLPPVENDPSQAVEMAPFASTKCYYGFHSQVAETTWLFESTDRKEMRCKFDNIWLKLVRVCLLFFVISKLFGGFGMLNGWREQFKYITLACVYEYFFKIFFRIWWGT